VPVTYKDYHHNNVSRSNSRTSILLVSRSDSRMVFYMVKLIGCGVYAVCPAQLIESGIDV